MFGNPFMAWADLAWKIGEMSIASAQVIAHRTTRMAAAGPLPNARDRKEFTRMGQEKVEAATESARAMAAHLGAMNLQLGARSFRSMMTGTTALMALASSRNIGQFIARQATLAGVVSRSPRLLPKLLIPPHSSRAAASNPSTRAPRRTPGASASADAKSPRRVSFLRDFRTGDHDHLAAQPPASCAGVVEHRRGAVAKTDRDFIVLCG